MLTLNLCMSFVRLFFTECNKPTNTCEEHVVQQQGNGHDDQDELPGTRQSVSVSVKKTGQLWEIFKTLFGDGGDSLPGLPGIVEVCTELGAGDVLAEPRLGTHPGGGGGIDAAEGAGGELEENKWSVSRCCYY